MPVSELWGSFLSSLGSLSNVEHNNLDQERRKQAGALKVQIQAWNFRPGYPNRPENNKT